MPTEIEVWSGRLYSADAPWNKVESHIKRTTGEARLVTGDSESPYRSRFSQGAIFAPRLLFMVEKRPPGPLGVPAGRVTVRSSRNANEKKPWAQLDSMDGVVETEFVRPLYNGENLLPYRMLEPLPVVVPWDSVELLGAASDRLELYPGLADWWRRAEQCWEAHRSTDRMSLLEQLDYRGKLTKQFPIPELRIVYNKSGMHLVAGLIMDKRAVINSGLYWTGVANVDEAYYLCAILNSPVTTELVRPYMSYGKDERDIHKHVWELPIQDYDRSIETHQRLANLGKQATALANNVKVSPDLHFSAQRRQIRNELASSEISEQIDQIVFEQLS